MTYVLSEEIVSDWFNGATDGQKHMETRIPTSRLILDFLSQKHSVFLSQETVNSLKLLMCQPGL